MSGATIIAITLALCGLVCVMGYVWVCARGRHISDDLLMLALICMILSCVAAPK